MNESDLIQLKIIVERAVRPLRASSGRKQKIREELLGHVRDVFDEEFTRPNDGGSPLDRTVRRFGNPAELTVHLQRSIPAFDGIVRYLEGPPDQSTLHSALRFVAIELAIAWAALAVAFLLVGWQSHWSRDELFAVTSGSGFISFWALGPLWLMSVVALACYMESALRGPEPLMGWPKMDFARLIRHVWKLRALRVALIGGGACMLVSLGLGGFRWPLHPDDWSYRALVAAIPFTGVLASLAVVVAWFLVQTVGERRRRLEEWSRLPLESGAEV
jgi:hypothetical protein